MIKKGTDRRRITIGECHWEQAVAMSMPRSKARATTRRPPLQSLSAVALRDLAGNLQPLPDICLSQSREPCRIGRVLDEPPIIVGSAVCPPYWTAFA